VNVASPVVPQRATLPTGVDICAPALPSGAQILTPAALAFVAKLHRAFESRRQDLLTRRAARQREFDAGKFLDFIPETAQVRAEEWTIDAQPKDLLDRRVEITGPTESRLMISKSSSLPCLHTTTSTELSPWQSARV
jgi:malate synthase